MGWAKYEEDNFEITMDRLYLRESKHDTPNAPTVQKYPVLSVPIIVVYNDASTKSQSHEGRQKNDDIWLKCQDCGKKFKYSIHFQTVVAENGWAAPKRCRDCRALRKNSYPDIRFPARSAI